MNEYFTPPDPPASGARARSALIKEIIDAIDDAFDNIPAGLAESIDDLYKKWVDEIGLPTLVNGKFLTNDGTALEWDTPFPAQTGKTGFTMQTDGTNPVWVDLPRVGSFIATASGGITAGATVVLNSDGTVTEVAGGAGSPGTPVTFETGKTEQVSTCYDSTNNKIVIAYVDLDDSSYGKAVVGTVSGGTIEFGATVTFNAATTLHVSCCFADGVVFIAYEDGNDGAAIAGTVSGTGGAATITFGTPADFITAASITETACIYDEGADRVVVAFNDGGTCKTLVATLTGTAVAFNGSTQSFTGNNGAGQIDIAYDTNYERPLFFLSVIATVCIGVVTGDEIAIIDETICSNTSSYGKICYDTTLNKAVIFYSVVPDGESYRHVMSRVITVISGTGVSAGTSTYVGTGTTHCDVSDAVYDPYLGKAIALFVVQSTYSMYITLGTVSGTDISLSTQSLVGDAYAAAYAAFAIETVGEQLVISARNSYAASHGETTIVDHSTTAFDWIGLANSTVADGESVIINSLGSINDQQTGLTAGATYYVDVDGDITTSTTSYGEIGRALSATELLITKGGME